MSKRANNAVRNVCVLAIDQKNLRRAELKSRRENRLNFCVCLGREVRFCCQASDDRMCCHVLSSICESFLLRLAVAVIFPRHWQQGRAASWVRAFHAFRCVLYVVLNRGERR